MTYISPSHWARAFRRALEEKRSDDNILVQNTRSLMKKHGVLRQRDKIIRRISEEIVRFHGGRWIVVETARPLTNFQREKIVEAFSSKDYVEEHIRPQLIAGIRFVIDSEKEFDASLKGRFDKIV